MSVLTSAELQAIRNGCAAKAGTVAVWTKAQLNAGAQAIEDALTSNASAISNAIDAATAPLVLSAAVKKELVAQVVFAKYLRDR